MSTLRRVSRVARARLSAELRYREAIEGAAQKHSYADIARAAGVSRQAVRQLVRRSRES